jgi:LPXTG-motif cell wall-anchored protein
MLLRISFLRLDRFFAVLFSLILFFILFEALPISAITINEFSIPTPTSCATGIATGSDGNLWFTEKCGNKIGRITPAGVITEFTIPTVNSDPHGITAGPDGNIWFTESNSNYGNKIGRITPSGVITEFPLPASSCPHGITAGPDGNLWFAEYGQNKIGRITPNGVITEYAAPACSNPYCDPYGITAGPDGNLWFTDLWGDRVGSITPSGIIAVYTVPTYQAGPAGIATGSDGNLWVTYMYGGEPVGSNSNIGRITPSGVITEFPVPYSGQLIGITAGPNGNLWFTKGCQIGRITPSGVIALFPVPFVTQCSPWGITEGPDHNIWFTDSSSDRILQLIVSTAPDISYTVTASAEGNGSISPSGAVSVNYDATQAYTVTPSTGSQAVMSGTCGGNLVGTTYTTNPITTNCTVTATFIPIGPTQELPSGQNVQVLVPVTNPSSGLITITFNQIDTGGGTLSVETSSTCSNMGVGYDNVTYLLPCFNITFTGGTYTGDIYVTIPYVLPVGSLINESELKIYHNGVACTTYSQNTTTLPHSITVKVTSLSPFGIGYYHVSSVSDIPRRPSTGANENMIALIAILAILCGVFLIRKRRMQARQMDK